MGGGGRSGNREGGMFLSHQSFRYFIASKTYFILIDVQTQENKFLSIKKYYYVLCGTRQAIHCVGQCSVGFSVLRPLEHKLVQMYSSVFNRLELDYTFPCHILPYRPCMCNVFEVQL